jgi:class 3 adenylate cyclase
MTETRRLAAILVADVVGYSRLAGSDEDRTLARLRGLRSDQIDPAIAAYHGRIVKRTGNRVYVWCQFWVLAPPAAVAWRLLMREHLVDRFPANSSLGGDPLFRCPIL